MAINSYSLQIQSLSIIDPTLFQCWFNIVLLLDPITVYGIFRNFKSRSKGHSLIKAEIENFQIYDSTKEACCIGEMCHCFLHKITISLNKRISLMLQLECLIVQGALILAG